MFYSVLISWSSVVIVGNVLSAMIYIGRGFWPLPKEGNASFERPKGLRCGRQRENHNGF
jgi:hypothetical protein